MCAELTELGRAWFASPGCGMYWLILEHRSTCPACLALAPRIEARRARLHKEDK